MCIGKVLHILKCTHTNIYIYLYISHMHVMCSHIEMDTCIYI